MQDLQVQCEAQVLLFVLDYIDGTQVEPAVAAQLFQHVSSLSHMLISRDYATAHPFLESCTSDILLSLLCTADWLAVLVSADLTACLEGLLQLLVPKLMLSATLASAELACQLLLQASCTERHASIYDWWLLYTPLYPALTAPFPLLLALCFSHALQTCAGTHGISVQRAAGLATAAVSELPAIRSTPAGRFAAAEHAGSALRDGFCPDAASQQLLQQPAVWLARWAGAHRPSCAPCVGPACA